MLNKKCKLPAEIVNKIAYVAYFSAMFKIVNKHAAVDGKT